MKLFTPTYSLTSLLIGLFLSGCVSTQSSNFKETSSAYREVVEQYANDNILLNIVRASKDMPMSFLDIPSVVGSGSYTASAGATGSNTLMNGQSPLDPLGRFLSSNTANYGGTLGMTVNNSFTFTQSSLDNAHFMGKFLEDVPPETIRFYGSQKNLPRVAMLLLLIDAIEIKTIDNEEVAWWVNDPRSGDYKSFEKFLSLLLDVGLTVESNVDKTPLGPPISEAQFTANYAQFSQLIKDVSDSAGKSLEKVSINGKSSYQLYKTSTSTRFCINKYKAEAVFGSQLGRSSYCKDSTKDFDKPSSKNYQEFLGKMLEQKKLKSKELVLFIKLRSTANVFDFLGNALIAQYQNPSKLIMVTSKDISTFKPDYQDPPISRPLFKVYKNGDLEDVMAKITYKSDVYYIKDNDGTYTKSVFEFLSTLLTLSKRFNAMPPSPTILVR